MITGNRRGSFDNIRIFGDGLKRPSSPYFCLLAAVYRQAIEDMREYPICSQMFESAAAFLKNDPYGFLPDGAYDAIMKEITERRQDFEKWKGEHGNEC